MSKGDCIVMGYFNHGNTQWGTSESTGVEDQHSVCLIQGNFIARIGTNRRARVLYLVLSSQKEFVDNVKIHEPLGSSDHNQLHFNINKKIRQNKSWTL